MNEGHWALASARPTQIIGASSPACGIAASKATLDQRLKSLRAALTEAERLNKAVKAGRTPARVVARLQTLEGAGLIVADSEPRHPRNQPANRTVHRPVATAVGGHRPCSPLKSIESSARSTVSAQQ